MDDQETDHVTQRKTTRITHKELMATVSEIRIAKRRRIELQYLCHFSISPPNNSGKIFVYDVAKVVKIRTGEEDMEALQDVE